MKAWQVLSLVGGGGLVAALIIFAGGEPDQVVINGSTFTLAQVTQTIEAGPVTNVPTPHANSRDICYVDEVGSGSLAVNTIVAIQPAQSRWGPGEQGTPGPNGARFLVQTLKLSDDALTTIAPRNWRVILDADGIPTGVEAIP